MIIWWLVWEIWLLIRLYYLNLLCMAVLVDISQNIKSNLNNPKINIYLLKASSNFSITRNNFFCIFRNKITKNSGSVNFHLFLKILTYFFYKALNLILSKYLQNFFLFEELLFFRVKRFVAEFFMLLPFQIVYLISLFTFTFLRFFLFVLEFSFWEISDVFDNFIQK